MAMAMVLVLVLVLLGGLTHRAHAHAHGEGQGQGGGGGGGCTSSLDCSLNGACGVHGTCVCDAGWRADDCGELDLVPADSLKGAYQHPVDLADCSTSCGPSSWGTYSVQVQVLYEYCTSFSLGLYL